MSDATQSLYQIGINVLFRRCNVIVKSTIFSNQFSRSNSVSWPSFPWIASFLTLILSVQREPYLVESTTGCLPFVSQWEVRVPEPTFPFRVFEIDFECYFSFLCFSLPFSTSFSTSVSSNEGYR